jgi:hypothetical protein
MCVITKNIGNAGQHLSPATARIQKLTHTQRGGQPAFDYFA